MEGAPQSSWQRYVVYRETVYAVDEKVLVGNNEHQAFVARRVREGDDTVLVRWESTGAREEVAVGDVKKIDLDAKRPRRKRRDASGAEAAAPARRRKKTNAEANDAKSGSDHVPRRIMSVAEIQAEYQREQEAARAAASDAEDNDSIEEYEKHFPPRLREEIDQRMKALQFADRTTRPGVVQALEKLADAHIQNRTAIARRLVRLVSSKTANQEAAAEALASLAHKSWSNSEAIWAAGGIEALVALLTHVRAGRREKAARALANLPLLRSHGHGSTMEVLRTEYQCAMIAEAIATAGGIKPLVALLKNDTGCQREAARALANLACTAANLTAIAAAGGVEALVELVRSGEAEGQEAAAVALGNLARDETICTAIAAASGIEALVALVRNGATRGQEQAARALGTLAWDDAANQATIGKRDAERALKRLPLAERFSRLQSENASLKRRLGEEDVVSLRDGEAPLPAKESSALRDAHDKQQAAVLRRVKEEKLAAEGARDRNDTVAAAASADAAGATSKLEDAQELTGHLVQSENNKMSEIDELRRTVSERDARIEALEAEVAALREQLRGGGRAKRPRA